LTTTATTTVNVIGKAVVLNGALQGTVVESSRPQAGLEVSLLDAKGKLSAKTKTKPDGSFVFNPVAPGRYTVSVRKIATQRKANVKATVEQGKTTNVALTLLL
jgi:hypothetical protein